MKPRETDLCLEGGIELGRDAVDFQNQLLFVFLSPARVCCLIILVMHIAGDLFFSSTIIDKNYTGNEY